MTSAGQTIAAALLATGFTGVVVVPNVFTSPEAILTPMCPEVGVRTGVQDGKDVIFFTMVCETGVTTLAVPAVPEPRPEEEVPF
jgi:hypothetical protein